MSKPLSAKITSPGSNFLRIPQCSVKYLSLTRPPHDSDTKAITPCGAMPIGESLHAVFLCL